VYSPKDLRAPPSPPGLDRGSKPTFSVVIPAYQAAATIAEAVGSALVQTLRPHEVIVCDDGSTDDLEVALRPYRDRIMLIRKENGGEGSAKNAASRAAIGDFVVVLDADDAFLPERLEALAELAQARPDLDILTTDAFLESDGEIVRRAYGTDWQFEVDNQRRGILERNFVFGAAAIRRARLEAAGGFDATLRYAADWDLWIRLILSGSSAGLVAEPLYRYRIGPNALSARRGPLVRGFVAVLERAAARSDLKPDERRAVEHSLEVRRRELALLELDEALEHRSGQIRFRATAVLGRSGVSPRARLKATAAFVSPRLAARLRELRRTEGWVGAGGTFVAAAPARRLVAYSDAEEIGGAEVSLGHVLAGLDRQYQVSVVGVDERVVAYLAARRPEAGQVVLRPVRRKYDIGDVLQHLRTIRALRPDVVHVSLKTPWACPYGILSAWFARARIVLVEQSLFPEDRALRRAVSRFSARRATAVVAVGDQSAREIERLLRLPTDSVQTIRNGVPDVHLADAPDLGERPVIGSVGRLDPEKGFETVVRALPGLPVKAVVVGDGPDRARLEELAAELGVGDRFIVTGWEENARRYLDSFTVFCLPSRSESFPLTIVEAMLAGLPVVATDVGSVSEAVRHGETGFLVRPDDPEDLAGALARLLDDDALREQMGRRGRALAQERFTSERMVEAFERLYEEILA
jgi:glycosyltransferase involved in cell wall biosynthesis